MCLYSPFSDFWICMKYELVLLDPFNLSFSQDVYHDRIFEGYNISTSSLLTDVDKSYNWVNLMQCGWSGASPG